MWHRREAFIRTRSLEIPQLSVSMLVGSSSATNWPDVEIFRRSLTAYIRHPNGCTVAGVVLLYSRANGDGLVELAGLRWKAWFGTTTGVCQIDVGSRNTRQPWPWQRRADLGNGWRSRSRNRAFLRVSLRQST